MGVADHLSKSGYLFISDDFAKQPPRFCNRESDWVRSNTKSLDFDFDRRPWRSHFPLI